ncbi:JAB domain-containing protein [Emticicia sp. BO119]|uniref:JAB domain-containing protein n=1 Tax=Emticicia sp. BO119 TaxID=2757768 RepID=UPI0015F0B55E|nr:JAB domain-containing protein [Emticicia sp. BO119]MBA4850480.1 JAB domain-containing protein [Emticicia sp. BO119]
MQIENVFSQKKVAEIELSYTPHLKPSELPKVQDSEYAYSLFLHTWDKNKLEFIEQFRAVFLTRANRVLGICTLSTGGTNSTVIDIKVLFAAAIKSNASAMIIAHNHPSGNLQASESDIILTKRIDEVGQLLGIILLDHLIITADGYFSLKDQGAF